MNALKKITVVISVAVLFLAAGSAFALERPMMSVPLIEMIREGKAKVSADKTTIVDEKGQTVAKETTPPTPAVRRPVVDSFAETTDRNPPDSKEVPANEKYFFTCSYKCGITVKKCYQDNSGFIICLNICDKESFICEQHDY